MVTPPPPFSQPPYGYQPGPPHGYQAGPPMAAPTPEKPKSTNTLDLSLRFMLALVFTPIFVGVAVSLQQYQLLGVLVVTLVVVAALGGGHGLLERFPALDRVKILGGVLRLTGDLDKHYRQHPPRSFLYYIVYPVYAVVGAAVSKDIRREVVLHLRLMLVVTVLVVLDLVTTYGKLYPPYLSWTDALKLLVVELALIVIVSSAYLMPMVTTVYAFGASGRKWPLRVLVFGSVVLSIPFAYGGWAQSRDKVPWLAQGRLTARLGSPLFRQHLLDATDMYLGFARGRGAFEDVGDAPVVVEIDSIRRLMRGLVPEGEDKGFTVVAMQGPGGVWTGLRMLQSKRAFLLIVRAPKGSIATHWAQLPPEIQKKFSIGQANVHDKDASRIALTALIDDFHAK